MTAVDTRPLAAPAVDWEQVAADALAALARVEAVCRDMEQRGYQPSYTQAARWIRAAVHPTPEEN